MKESKSKLVVYGSDVLDLTTFNHPGPQNLIDDRLGTNLQEDFDS